MSPAHFPGGQKKKGIKTKGKFSLPFIKYLVNLRDQQQTDRQTVSWGSGSSNPG